MKFTLKDGLLYIPITVRYHRDMKEIPAIIDTGSAGTAVDINAFNMDLSRDATIRDLVGVGVGGKQRVIVQHVEAIIIGKYQATTFPVEFCDFDDSFGVQAFIGSDFLKLALAKIDYETEDVTLGTAMP